MLAYFLATLMAIISLILYLNAFISPKIHRQDDFLWSGLGLFYALTLWVCAGRITGAVLLGQLAIISVAIAFIWENRQLRKTIIADSQSRAVLQGVSLLSLIAGSLDKLSQLTLKKPKPSVTSKTKTDKPVETEEKIDVVEETKVTDSEKNVSSEVKTESATVAEDIITDIATSQKVENIIEEIVSDTPKDDSPQEDNIIEEIVNQQTNKEENILEDDFDIDSLGLTESSSEKKPSSPPKATILSKFLGIFRKPSPPKTPQPQEPVSQQQPLEDSSLEENTVEIKPQTTETDVEDAMVNTDLPESNNNIPEDSTKTPKTSPETDKIIETSVEISTPETEIIADTPLESDVKEEDTSLLTDLESDDTQEGEIELLPENTDTDLSQEIYPQDIPAQDIIETLTDLPVETENAALEELSSEEDNQNPMDELDHPFEDEVKINENQ